MLGLALFSQDLRGQQYTRYSAPETFSYQELLALSQDQEFEPDLSEKLRRITFWDFYSSGIDAAMRKHVDSNLPVPSG
jgi:hypothetical protein